MKLTKKLEAEVLKAYNECWMAYLKGDLKTHASLLSAKFKIIGTSEGEQYDSKKEWISYCRKTIKQFAGVIQKRKSHIKLLQSADGVMVIENAHVYVLIDDSWSFYSKLRISALLQKEKTGWKYIHQHGSFPDTKANADGTIATEQIKAENLQLREAVKRRTAELESKNRELEIEAALERTRTQSMLMQNSDEILNVSSVFHEQLVLLGIPTEFSYVWLPDEAKQEHQFWATWAEEENGTSFSKSKAVTYPLDKTEPYTAKCFAAWQSNEPIYVEHIPPPEVKNYFSTWEELLRDAQKMKAEFFPEGLYYAEAYIKYGCFGINIRRLLSADEEQILQRFTVEFERTYTRFLDLQKAEAQAREAKIEAALERIRANAIGMHHSNELSDVLTLLFQQYDFLDIHPVITTLNLFDIEKNQFTHFTTGRKGRYTMTRQTLALNASETWRTSLDEWMKMKSQSISIIHYPVEVIPHIFELFKELRAAIPESDRVQVEDFPNGMFQTVANCKFGTIGFIHSREATEEEKEIVTRFAREFERLYQRFLDLQKAEAQTREAQIELTLEKVRARAMSMRHSDELSDVLSVLFEQFDTLGISPVYTFLSLIDLDKNLITYRQTGKGGRKVLAEIQFPLNSLEEWEESVRRIKAGDFDSVNCTHYSLETLPKVWEVFGDIYDALPEGSKVYPQDFPNGIYTVQGYCKYGYIGYDHDREWTGEEKTIVQRFAVEFGRLYQHFLDLQKAEAQARESQIQLALERVRARTMAMQHSDELKDAAALLFQQVKSLGVPAYSCGYNIWEKDEKEFTSWMSTQDGSDFSAVSNIPLTEDANFIRFADSRKNGEQFFVLELRGERMQEHYQYLKTIPAFKAYFDYAVSVGFDLPETQIHHLANFSQGNLLFITLEPCPEFHEVFKRFAAVFDQTYTRFLDLQKAEAQAREAQIEAALEKVRSRSLAMHKSDEVQDVINTLFERLKELEIETDTASILITNNDSKETEAWIQNSEHTYSSHVFFPFFEKSIISREFLDVMEGGWDLPSRCFTKEEKNEWFTFLFEHSDLKHIPDERKRFVLAGEAYSISIANAKTGAIFLGRYNAKAFGENEHAIIKRFAKVFEQAYTRFLDLQKAEAQAREAKIEAALEKVRSRSLAMHKSDEIEGVLHTLFERLKELDIDFYTAIIILFEKGSKDVVWWLKSKANHPFRRALVPYTDIEYLRNLFEARQNGTELISNCYPFEEKNKLFRHLFDHTDLKNTPEEQKEFLLETEFATISVALAQNTGIHITSYSRKSFSEQDNEIFKRFAKVFEQAYTRFLDLQKAEAQAREAQIETALEKVRSRSLAMHKSDELREVVAVVFEKLVDLGFSLDDGAVGILIFSPGSRDHVQWIVDPSNSYTSSFGVAYTDHSLSRDIFSARESGKDFFAKIYPVEEKNEYFNYLFDYNESYKQVPVEIKNLILGSQEYGISVAFEKNAAIVIPTNSGKLVIGDNIEILKRFVRVFEQAYTRFLDLQKAEAQAREAKIEVSLERVRSRSMAMHKSQEVMDVAVTVYDELQKLDFQFGAATIIIMDKETGYMEHWLAGFIQKNHVESYPVNNINHPLHAAQLAAWRKGEKFVSIALSGSALKAYAEEMFTQTGYKNLPDEEKTMLSTNEQSVFNLAYMSHGALMWAPSALPDEKAIILQRFAKVFEQTYTRFLDLQKAEAQAKEAKIEAALERVRSRTMGMQKSEELKEVIQVVYEQFVHLNIHIEHTGFIMDYKARDDMHIWLADQHEVPFQVTIPYFDCAHWNSFNEAKEKGLDFFANHLSFEEKNRFYQDLFKLIPGVPEETLEYYFSCPGLAISTVLLDNVGLYIENFSGIPYSNDENATLMRFGKVFQQTYTRFLDLQKAEAQAREATIEAALERVRGKAMAMHSSENLAETIGVFYRELRSLSATPRRCGVALMDKESGLAEITTMNTTEEGDSIEIMGKVKVAGHPVLDGILAHWVAQKEYHPVLRGAEVKEYYDVMRPQVAFPDYPTDSIQFGYYYMFDEGWVYAWTEKELPEDELKIYRRFTSVLSLTYKRYKDLKDAEARAQIAVKDAALDRIRADIASMRTTNDLERITPLIWNELIILGVPFIRCGVFIMDEAQQLIHTFLSTPDGKAIGAFHLPYATPGNISRVINHWRDNQNYIAHWDESAFTDLAGMLVKQGAIPSTEQYLSTIPHGGFHLHFLPFLQGMLYVGNTTRLGEDEIRLIQSVADAFSTAYARYEDFNKLEAAKQQVDRTLVDLKQAQTQLVQSEKMASLGELTAGIAHEIQNPLNFVNNFSDVSNELLEEMKGELTTGNMQQAIEIAENVKQNLEKILHHGKRADAIVKGMLQHSRTSSSQKEPTDINVLADEYLRLAYHGLRAKDKSFNAKFETDFDINIGKLNIIPQEIGRVILNLINNAFYAVSEKKKELNGEYEPTVSITTKTAGDNIEVRIKDNGIGIPQKVLDKIFQPFFTTKPTGQGTGLGLSLAYDIVKAHGGELKVETKDREGTEFTIQLPLYHI